MCDEPFPAALLLPTVVVGHNLTAITQEMLDADLDHAVGATYIIQVLRLTFILLMWTFGRDPNNASK
jgi:hypothetical protein